MKRYPTLITILALAVLLCIFPTCISAEALAEHVNLTGEQANAIAMLNYITVLTQDINASKNSRLYMEEAYSSLINNIYPGSVDGYTLEQLTGLLDTMEGYRMISIERDRLQYICEQNQAQAIRALVPSPLSAVNVTLSDTPVKIATSIAALLFDTAANYRDRQDEIELEYLQGSWELDDEEAAVLHQIRKSAFAYMVNMVSQYSLPGDLTLTENAVEEYVRWKNNDNVAGRIQFLQSNRAVYQSYGGYWLLLAQSYYDNGDYVECLDAIEEYDRLGYQIFRKDYELARVLPLVIAAAANVYDGDEYEALAVHYVQKILNNCNHDDWALRYYTALVYLDLFTRTDDAAYIEEAYGIALDNTNYLAGEQQGMNAVYLAPIQKATVPADATKKEKKRIKASNDALEEIRKTELPPISEPLRLNCELLFELVQELAISESEMQKIDNMLHPGGEQLFLVEDLDERYWFTRETPEGNSSIDLEFGGTAIILPAVCCTNDTEITVLVQDANAGETVVLTDWKVDLVERVMEGEVNTYRVVYTSDEARKHEWLPDSKIQIDIQPKADADIPVYHYEFVTEGTKKEWYDYLKVWEGHKNNWYDYAKVWENSVEFVQQN